MKKALALSLLLAALVTTGGTCKKDEPAAPPAPQDSASGETGAAAPSQDEAGMGEASEVKDGQTHED